MGKMSESIPLSATLRIHYIDIVVREIWSQGLNFVFEDLAAKCRLIRDIEWQANEELRERRNNQGE